MGLLQAPGGGGCASCRVLWAGLWLPRCESEGRVRVSVSVTAIALYKHTGAGPVGAASSRVWRFWEVRPQLGAGGLPAIGGGMDRL